ncbi:MAG: flavodoxin, partial [Bacteroidales bacterium]|nr:flavodoxin [Bacteroidales bacterium]
YYSQTGTTRAVAEELQKQLNADIELIAVEVPYDGSYGETIERYQQERAAGELPVLKPLASDLTKYETIFLGYPVWFGTLASPMAALVNANDFAGKKIVPFCTFGSGGLNTTTQDLKKALPQAQILEGYGVRTARIGKMAAELDQFLKLQGYVEGEAVKLPEFSTPKAVTDEEIAIFDAACGDYQFPLGTPITVGKRAIAGGTEYLYQVAGRGMDGKESTSLIYVVDMENEKPEFTQVVR